MPACRHRENVRVWNWLAAASRRPSKALHALALDQGHDPAEVSARRPDARAILAVAQAVGAPLPGPARNALPLYVRDRVALDRTEQRQAAALRETVRQQEASPPARNGTRP